MTPVTSESLAELTPKLRGEALTPTDPGYEDGGIPEFNAMHQDRPGPGCPLQRDSRRRRGRELRA